MLGLGNTLGLGTPGHSGGGQIRDTLGWLRVWAIQGHSGGILGLGEESTGRGEVDRARRRLEFKNLTTGGESSRFKKPKSLIKPREFSTAKHQAS